ncbi:uncharacterized protein LDX57_010595 [Aspergillus melleus]|uniref:uncharacterized protein n=1 Tax=Aspergillus melleus TaxID=138277 RepID=UPI001E8E0E3B|nr:uncharacterized protein LDX57_010595 [Aspergillus melleus]KAH8432960.1 hypothetical protein LDX57_010595 [Aspergillus melleus]
MATTHTSSFDEKVSGAEHLESIQLEEGNHDMKNDNVKQEPIYGIDEAHQKRVIRRVDLRLLPILGLMYSISLIDRTNLGLALVAGMQEDLGLDVGQRYTIIVMVFFVAYIVFEIPSNLVLPKAGAANWLSFLGVSFGAILIGIFIVEGSITCGVCLIGRLIIVDFPHKADGFLKPEEKQFVIDRINNDRGDAEEDSVTLERILHHLKDWKLYIWAFNLMASTLPGYAYSYFKTIILMGMGFSNTQSQLLSAPPYILAAATTYLSGWLTDKYQIRGPVIAVHQLLTAVGMIITAYGQVNGARYFGVFLGVGVLQFCIPGVLAFQANNITSHSKRAVASATCLIGGGLGGIIASVAFKSDESPYYTTGIWVTFAITMVSIVLTLGMDFYFWRVNKKARESGGSIEGMQGWYYTL